MLQSKPHPHTLSLPWSDFLTWAEEAPDLSQFLSSALGRWGRQFQADFAAVAQAEKGRWTTLGSSGPSQSLPESLLADVLDAGRPGHAGSWYAAPLGSGQLAADLVVVHHPEAHDAALREQWSAWCDVLGQTMNRCRSRLTDEHRIRRLEAILAIAGQWNRNLEMESLLQLMAETSTRLLDAERASIFLWDRASRTLVGRPALGIEGNELRIPDDMGVVGQVIRTGMPKRVDRDVVRDQQEIDRHVDRELGFHTRTLLCVPLRGQSGELFGAFEMINKREGNFTDDDEEALVELATHAAIALENTQQMEDLVQTRKHIVNQAADQVQLIGNSPAIEALRSTVRRVADTDLAVLILGENGTGKEVVSQMIHYHSRRRNEPFIAVNCAAITETLLESELFGHEKGAFTDARETRIGKFELASKGTLFLDEIGDMSLAGQSKLLRVLEEKVVVRVGGSTPIPTNARILAATNQDLAAMVRAKKFREDLYFRLNVVTLDLPPLRERGDDIAELAEHFLRDFCRRARRRIPKLTAAARKRLLAHAWPGNVRELRNLMERLAYLTTGDKVDADDLAFILSPDADSPSSVSMDLTLAQATDTFQTDYIRRHIRAAGNQMTIAAERLGLHRSNLYRKMRQLGMPLDEAKGDGR